MPRAATEPRPVTAQTQGFDGGVNLRDTIVQLGQNELRISENGTLDERGGWSKRLGCATNGVVGTAITRIISEYTFYRGDQSPQVLVQTSDGDLLYTVDPASGSVSWLPVVTGLDPSSPLSFETFNGTCYFSNGVDDYASWDGASYTAFPSAPKGRYLRLWKDTMFNSGITGLEDRVYESAPGDAETWPVASWIDISKGDGDSVTALGTDGVVLVVFKRGRVITINDPTTLANRVIDFEKGCESHFSVIQAVGDLFFLSRHGICIFDESSPARYVSQKIDPLFDPLLLDLNLLNTVHAYTIANRIGWSLPEAGGATFIQVEYYPRLGPISVLGSIGIGPWVFHRIPTSIFTTFRSGPFEGLFGNHISANKFMQIFAPVGTDDGQTFTAIMETGSYDFGAATLTKYIRRVRILGRGDVTFQLRRNFATAIYKTFPISMSSNLDLWSLSDEWGGAITGDEADFGDAIYGSGTYGPGGTGGIVNSGTWGPDSIFKEAKVNPDAYGRHFQLRFSDSSPDVSHKQVEVGSREYSISAGEWAVYLVTLEADLLGVRD